jgi:hypothetical protein
MLGAALGSPATGEVVAAGLGAATALGVPTTEVVGLGVTAGEAAELGAASHRPNAAAETAIAPAWATRPAFRFSI